MDNTFVQDRITSIKARIIALEDASIALATGGIESYTIDTGQSRQTVTKMNIEQIQNVIDGLMNQLVVYEARITGNGVLIGRPGF